jgi:hypothetical protein
MATFDIVDEKKVKKESIRSETKELDTGIYIVPSFNGWLPIPLKNLLQILQSSYDEELLIPENFVYDPALLLYANFIPPGRHYFYLVKNNSYFFLSPRY